MKDYLLGEDWYVAYSGSAKQITTDIVYDILKKYSKKFRKELKIYEKRVINEANWRNGRAFIGNKKNGSKKDVCCIYISAMQQISMNVTT